MISRVSKFYEVKIQYIKMLEDGKEKKVTEQYVVEALSFTEAEARITEEMNHYTDGDFDVVSEKIAPYNEILLSDNSNDDKWFLSKVAFITIDEKTAKEKKTSQRLLVQAETSEKAMDYTKEMLSHYMSDYSIDSVQDTPTLDVSFLCEVKKEVVENPEDNSQRK